MVRSSRKDSYFTNVCFLNGGSLDELHHVIHSLNASTDTCEVPHVRFYTWKQTLFLFPYLFPACLFLLLCKICHWYCYLNLLLPLRPIIAKTTFIAHAWISVWGERAWNGDFTIVVMAASTCAPLRRFALIFLNVLLTEKKDTDSDFLGAFASLTDLALGWSETLIPGNNFSTRLVWFHPLGRETAHTSCRTFNCRTAQLKPSAIGVFIQFCTTLL